MATATVKTDQLLAEVLREVRAVRRELSLVVPSERLEEYKNAAELTRAYREAKRELASVRRTNR